MKRDVGGLATETYDILVIGAGIHGACVARDAALRGFRVALVDQGDFGGATSHNSLKLIHGGLRYLQHADFRRVRQSVQERRFWLRAAPHLVRPLKFIIPLYGWGTRGPLAMGAAMQIYNLLQRGCNRGLPVDRQIPPAHLISREECRRFIPGVDEKGLSAGAVWYDGQMLDADRALLACVRQAQQVGASAANYVAVDGFIGERETVEGVRAIDLISGEKLEIRARMTVNTAGPWIGQLLAASQFECRPSRHPHLHKCMNLMTREFFPHYAVGIVSGRRSDSMVPRGGRLYFITPWRGRSIIGTTHVPFEGSPDSYEFRDDEINGFLSEVNAAYAPARLDRADVEYCYAGLTPATASQARARKTEIRDHEKRDGVSGLISVSGVKYTTARLVAERVVDLAALKLTGRSGRHQSDNGMLPGAKGYTEFRALAEEARAIVPSADEADIEDLITSYGTAFREVLRLGADQEADRIVAGRCLYALREEMAVRLSDLVFRRMNRTHFDPLDDRDLAWCACAMAKELRWSRQTREAELLDVQKKVARHRGAVVTV
ncbi:MAG: glycerol-3-phosphate dehydrogenase/oxidase [Gemmatimonadota bacterium]|nr:MAG: glycerol-3-phosphate dehydrogenase/oxidase [Gemmatimonadota bacterium]